MRSRNDGRYRWNSSCSTGYPNSGRNSAIVIGIILLIALAKGIKDWDKPRVVSVPENFQPMQDAIAKAQGSLDEFIAMLKNPRPSQSGFAVKARFKHDDGDEIMWIIDVDFDGQEFSGWLGNLPESVRNLTPGEIVRVARNDVVDWGYLQDGELVGAFTQSAMLEQLKSESP